MPHPHNSFADRRVVASRTCALVGGCLIALLAGAAPRVDPAPERIRANIAFLSDDLLEGRMAGTRGYDIAARYVATQFQQLGLKPAGVGGTWMQTVPLLEGSIVVPAASIVLNRDGKQTSLTPAEDFLPGVDFAGPESTLSAPLMFVGFGISAPEFGYDALANVDLKGKVAVVLAGAPANFPFAARAHYSSGLTKYPQLIAKGAVGMIALLTPEDRVRQPWERTVQASWRPRSRWVKPDGQPADSFPELRALFSLSPTGAEKVFAGAPQTLEQVFAAAAAATPQAFDLPGTATFTRKTLLGRKESANVIGMLEGSDPKLKDEYVVVTAHLDHVGKGAPVNGDAIYNGAMDNAAGIAVMLEVARALTESRVKPKRSVLFIALTAEESGLLGADYFARNPTVRKAGLVANINMDMPVMLAPIADVVGFGAENSTLGPLAARAAKAEGIRLSPDGKPEETFFVRSDQYAFVRQGIPALYLDNGYASADPKQDQKALVEDFLKNHYHQPSDDITRPISYDSLALLARVNVRIVLEVSRANQRPHWNAGDFFGNQFATPETRAPVATR